MEKKSFYGYRANIVINKLNTYNLDLDNKEGRNKLFNLFFDKIKDNRLQSNYNKRKYFLLFISEIDEIIYCQLARKREYSKYEMQEDGIQEQLEEDYPYVNIFIDTKHQKILIESKKTIFENIDTCKKTIENIMKSTLNEYDASIELIPMSDEKTFWDIIDSEKNNIYKITFKLHSPNFLGTETSAKELMDSVRDTTGADHFEFTFHNEEGNLKPKKEVLQPYVEYATDGAGDWSMNIKEKDGESKRNTIKSGEFIKKIDCTITYDESGRITSYYEEIKKAFNKIENVDEFKV